MDLRPSKVLSGPPVYINRVVSQQTWAVRSTQYSTLHLLVTLSNTSQCYLSTVNPGTPTGPRDYRSPAVSRDTGRYSNNKEYIVN
jgi:hypothetical protein